MFLFFFSIHFNTLRVEYYTLLKWSMKANMNITLLSQSQEKHFSRPKKLSSDKVADKVFGPCADQVCTLFTLCMCAHVAMVWMRACIFKATAQGSAGLGVVQ